MTYLDRDCWAALLRLAAAQRATGEDIAVVLPRTRRNGDQWTELREFAADLEVPIAEWSNERRDYGDTKAYFLQHRASCYGGGVRPVLFRPGSTGEWTPSWWSVSAGLGPGATNRETFCHIVNAATAIRQGRSDS